MLYLHLFENLVFLLTSIMYFCQITLISSSDIVFDEELS